MPLNCGWRGLHWQQSLFSGLILLFRFLIKVTERTRRVATIVDKRRNALAEGGMKASRGERQYWFESKYFVIMQV